MLTQQAHLEGALDGQLCPEWLVVGGETVTVGLSVSVSAGHMHRGSPLTALAVLFIFNTQNKSVTRL